MKILILANFGMGLYNFRKELVEELLNQKHDVYISLPNDEYVPKLKEMGCTFIETLVDRRGTNPNKDLKLLRQYIKIIRDFSPDVVLTYTIKPNIYGGLACTLTKTPYLTNITGLGTAIENRGLVQKITLGLYKMGLNKSSCVFFQNKNNQDFFKKSNIVKSETKLIPGSGVNIVQHNFEKYPSRSENIRFLFIGRIMKAKGIDELLLAAKAIKKIYPSVQFDLIGGCEEDYIQILQNSMDIGVINYLGQQSDVHSFIKKSHAIVLPSHHEGLANVLLESSSSGRPVLASNIPGCIETFEEGVTGIGFQVKNVDSLVKALIKFINLVHEEKVEMGKRARKKVETEFNRELVVKAYINQINKLKGAK